MVLALWGLVVLGLAGPVWAAGEQDGVSADRVRIGMVNAQTGPAAALGQAMLAGSRAVFEHVNAQGGVHGRRLELLVADDGYEPEQTVEHTLQLVQNDKVFALFGYVGTPTTNAVLPLLRELHVPLVGVVSGATSLRRPLTAELFNVRASYEQEAENLVTYLLASGAQKVSVVYQNDGFGVSVLAAVNKALKANASKLHSTASFQRNTVAVKMALGTMMESEPDAVVVVGPYTPVAAFINQARAKGLKPRFATVSFVGTESLLERLPDGGGGVLVSQVVPNPADLQVPVVQDCRALLGGQGGGVLTYLTLEGCLTAKVLVEALHRAGPALSRSRLQAVLSHLQQFDVGGLTLSFSPQNHQASDRVYLTQLLKGRVEDLR
jgi:ABC-type branched-subunit amino acid transport system substrate-binding protein